MPAQTVQIIWELHLTQRFHHRCIICKASFEPFHFHHMPPSSAAHLCPSSCNICPHQPQRKLLHTKPTKPWLGSNQPISADQHFYRTKQVWQQEDIPKPLSSFPSITHTVCAFARHYSPWRSKSTDSCCIQTGFAACLNLLPSLGVTLGTRFPIMTRRKLSPWSSLDLMHLCGQPHLVTERLGSPDWMSI